MDDQDLLNVLSQGASGSPSLLNTLNVENPNNIEPIIIRDNPVSESPLLSNAINAQRAAPVFDIQKILTSGPRLSSDPSLAEAQKLRSEQLAGAALSRGGEKALAGGIQIAGGDYKPDYAAVEAQERLSQLPITGIEEQQKFQQNQITGAQAGLKLNSELESESAKRNPNSLVSQVYREVAKRAKLNVPDNTPAKALEDIVPKLKDLVRSEMTEFQKIIAENASKRLEQAAEKERRLGIKQQHQIDEKAELSDKQVEEMIKLDSVLDSLNNIEQLKKIDQINTGPVAGRVAALRQSFGADDAKVSAFKAETIRTLASYIRSISGTAASDQERAVLMKALPNANDADDTFLSKLENFKKEQQRLRNLRIKSYQEYQRKEIPSSMKMQPGEVSSNEIKRRTKDGKVAVFNKDTEEFLRYE